MTTKSKLDRQTEAAKAGKIAGERLYNAIKSRRSASCFPTSRGPKTTDWFDEDDSDFDIFEDTYEDDNPEVDKLARKIEGERRAPSMRDVMNGSESRVSELELERRRLEKAMASNTKALEEARRVQQWFKVLEAAETDPALRESVDQLITMYNLKIDHK